MGWLDVLSPGKRRWKSASHTALVQLTGMIDLLPVSPERIVMEELLGCSHVLLEYVTGAGGRGGSSIKGLDLRVGRLSEEQIFALHHLALTGMTFLYATRWPAPGAAALRKTVLSVVEPKSCTPLYERLEKAHAAVQRMEEDDPARTFKVPLNFWDALSATVQAQPDVPSMMAIPPLLFSYLAQAHRRIELRVHRLLAA